MLLTLLYHRAVEGKYGNSPTILQQHLEFIAKNYPVVLPGDPIPVKTSICLTFDDAYSDFYSGVFPLLKRFHLKALLAVPVKCIIQKGPFCSWEELQEMVQSGFVKIASHSYSHINLLEAGNLELEIVQSKEILEKQLHCPIDTFVYPFGKFDLKLHRWVKKHYSYVMRIGSACNFSWQNMSGLIYRIPCDRLTLQELQRKLQTYPTHIASFLMHSLRFR